ncbi:Metallo-hydrolase/oxidoreductase [Viridothelium virens]|uniref:Metallo-hydrolase/oxidoreductase n=1 Tax=Viridothelium virens TaxID=1048519 RepID=A0A6A6HK87_VIRVR|nr:Metallo-hydrolase/oxidoreductase [Viridothelium virens]
MPKPSTSPPVTITRLPAKYPPNYPSTNPAHHVGSPPSSFRNPWPSAGPHNGLLSALETRFGRNRNFVPVPSDRTELVGVRKPDWGKGKPGLKATWIGHASFLIETTTMATNGGKGEQKGSERGKQRGVRILLDPVFSERTSPSQWFGPKRYTPTPCKLEELPEVDVVVISHNHYDHLDAATIREVDRMGKGRVRYLCGIGNKGCLEGIGVRGEDVVEMDWWDGVEVEVEGVGKVKIVCTPAQHFSGRAVWNMGAGLWCSWVIEENLGLSDKGDSSPKGKPISVPRKLYFAAGDTGYRARPSPEPKDLSTLPHCPAFSEIGNLYGPFNLALLPIGLYSPPSFMSTVHCAPEDSACIHRDIKSRKSIGMHWGTVRGGLSAQYEDVREPPRRWKESCEKAGLRWGQEVGLCDIGETVTVSS